MPTPELAPSPAHTLSRGWGTQVQRFPRFPAACKAQPISSEGGASVGEEKLQEPRRFRPVLHPLRRGDREGLESSRTQALWKLHSSPTLQDIAAPLGPHPPAELIRAANAPPAWETKPGSLLAGAGTRLKAPKKEVG